MNKLTRYFDTEIRQAEEDNRTVVGKAVVFDVETDMGWYTEKIDRHAFDGADLSDVVLNLNHDMSILLAGTRNGSMAVKVSDTGVYQEASIIDTTQGEDALILVRSGLINKMSFQFTIAEGGDKWETKNGREYRTITKVDKVYDLSLVTFPAYSQTSVFARSEDKLAQEHKALIERRAEQDKKMEEIFNGNGKNLI